MAGGAVAGAIGWTNGLPLAAQLATAALVALALGALAWDLAILARRRTWTLIPPPSPSGILLGLGISLAIVGAATRLWLMLFGIDAALVGLLALTAELRGALPQPPLGD